MSEHRTPTPADAKRRARVSFIIAGRRRVGTLTYWPGERSERPPTVVVGDSRYHPDRSMVRVEPEQS
jgi:hypothetical protein